MRAFSMLHGTWFAVLFAIGSVGLVGFGSLAVPAGHSSAPPSALPSTTLVAAPPVNTKGPDDLAWMAVPGLDHGTPLVWTAFQNGINPDGTPGTPGGPNRSTLAGFDPVSGALVYSVNVTGKLDGLAADPSRGVLLATANEDDNSDLNVIDPSAGTVTTYQYAPSPAVNGVGGTDSIAVIGDAIYVSHSNPNDTTQATEYSVNLNAGAGVAALTPVFSDDSVSNNALGGTGFALALTDPDTNFPMPRAGERFAGDLATISQGDGKIVFASHPGGHLGLWVLNLTDNVSGNLPPVDGIAVATSDSGTLYVVDAKNQTISALATNGFPRGTIFVSEPNDNGNPLLGTLDPWTGVITPLGNHFESPKGLLFVPSHGVHPQGDDNGQGDDQGGNSPGDNGQGNWGSWFFGRW